VELYPVRFSFIHLTQETVACFQSSHFIINGSERNALSNFVKARCKKLNVTASVPDEVSGIFIDLILPASVWNWGRPRPSWILLVWMKTSQPFLRLLSQKMGQPRRFTSKWASTVCYISSFTFNYSPIIFPSFYNVMCLMVLHATQVVLNLCSNNYWRKQWSAMAGLRISQRWIRRMSSSGV
jgi:hypothetical protein